MPAIRCRGHSLAEVLIVCAVLAVAAAVALPTAQPVAEFRADTAAGDVALALRFARQAAVRAGAIRMLGCDQANNRLAVYIPDTNGAAATMLKNPLRKDDYFVRLDQNGGGQAVIASCSFVYADKGSASTVAFDADGNPVRGTGDPKKQAQALSSGAIVLNAGGALRTVNVDATGRVTAS